MTIENPNTVDGLGISKLDGKVVMTISDHLDWNDLQAHIKILASKLEAYIAFSSSGDLEQTIIDARNREKRIELIHEYPPTPKAVEYLTSISDQLDSIGMEFTYSSLPPSY